MRTLGALLLILGALVTLLVAWLWWLRATADVGRPLPLVYVLTALGPLLAVGGGVLLRARRVDPSA
jgi:hypothetical protein